MKEIRFGEHHFLDFEVFLGSFSFNEVGCEGVGASNESKNSGFRTYFFTEGAEYFTSERSSGGGVNEVHLKRGKVKLDKTMVGILFEAKRLASHV